MPSAVTWIADSCSSCNATEIAVHYTVFMFLANINSGNTSVSYKQVGV